MSGQLTDDGAAVMVTEYGGPRRNDGVSNLRYSLCGFDDDDVRGVITLDVPALVDLWYVLDKVTRTRGWAPDRVRAADLAATFGEPNE